NSELEQYFNGRDIRFRYISPNREETNEPKQYPEYPELKALSAIEVSMRLKNDRVISAAFTPTFFISGNPLGAFVILFMIAVFISAVTLWLIHQTLRPLKLLEKAADEFVDNEQSNPIPEVGAEEIRRLASALNKMLKRVQSLIDDRTRITSAVAHDIRTMITRLRLRLDDEGDINFDAINRDLDEMRKLVEDMVFYSRSKQSTIQPELLDLQSFELSFFEDYPGEISVTRDHQVEKFTIAGDPGALRRALNNLIDNANRYGSSASVTTYSDTNTFLITIEDSGPGIPEDKLVAVFEPFYRLEQSRNRSTGGSGLGLGIAKALLETQGATLQLQNKIPGPGLLAKIRFDGSKKV
ncbi:MAG: ATP-binding protein, partial [Pseudomonadota bacterium]